MKKARWLVALAVIVTAVLLYHHFASVRPGDAVRLDPPPSASIPAVVARPQPSDRVIAQPAPGQSDEKQKAEAKTKAEAVADGLKTYKVGAYVRTHNRLAPFLRQSGLSDAEIDQAVELYVDRVFAKTAAERQAVTDKIKSLLGEEVCDGIEKAEEVQRNSTRDEALLTELKANLPLLPETDLAAAKAGFAKLPSYHTLFMQEVMFKPPSVAVAENLRAAAERAFDQAFAQSALSAAAYQRLKAAYVAVAVTMGPGSG